MSDMDPAGLAKVDISKLSEDNLRAVAEDLQQCYISIIEEALQRQKRLKSTMHDGSKPYEFHSSRRSSTVHSNWILSENEYPAQNSSVIYFDGRQIRVSITSDLNGKWYKAAYDDCISDLCTDNPAIISKLPSRWSRTVYVYTDSLRSTDSNAYFQVTSDKANNKSLRWLKTIHLGKLPAEVRFKVLLGNIKWLFIADNDSRSSTESSVESNIP